MKRKIILAFGISIMMLLFATSPVSANPCEGRHNCPLGICTDCGCDWDPICVCPILDPFCGRAPCDPRHNPTGICTPCGAAWQPPCLFETACDQGTFNIGAICAPCGDTWYPVCPTGDPCDPWHNPAVICTPCGGEGEPLCWTGEQCKPGYEVEGWEFPLCYAKAPAAEDEPETGYSGTVPQQPEGEPLWGWVQTHEHQFANLAYGGTAYWGQVFDEDGGVSEALAECDYTTAAAFDEVVLPTLWDGFDNPPEVMSEWLGELAEYYAGEGLGWLGDQLDWLATTILEPFGPVGDWLLSLLDQIPDDWDWLIGWLPDALDALIESLEPAVGPIADLLGPAFVQGLYVDLRPAIPPWDVVPRYGIHGDDPVNQPTSPSQFWLGLTMNIPVMDGPENFHRTSGWPDFVGWPTWDNGGHQQMYYKWLERAYQGGMRLLINLPVNNEVLCEMSFQRKDFQGGEEGSCADMPAVDRQIDRIYELEGFVDLENDGVVNGNGWYRVALSAGQARDIIEDGAMAVIIGIEVDTLFGCKPDTNYCCESGPETECLAKGYTSYEDFIDKKVQEYYDKGVRYVFPVHFWNNKFTGGAPYRDYFVYSQVLANGTCFDLYECSDLGYNYSIGGEVPALDFVFESITQKLGMPECTAYDDYEAVCNQLGLTEEGFTLIDELIARDMFIDQDHLPLRATSGYSVTIGGELQHWPGLLDIAEDWDGSRGYKYPVVSSHSSVRPDYDRGSEGGTFWSEAVRIRDLGGVISVPQPRGDCGTTRQFIDGGGPGANLLFTLPLDVLGDLQANRFTQGLWDAFATNGYTLTMPYTGTVEVETVDPGQDWRITDGESPQGLRFRVQLEEGGGTLNVYREFTLPLDLLDDLEAEEFTQGLWDAFATNGYTLTMPYTGTVEVETVQTDTGVEWQIQDFGPTGGARFRVKPVDSTLNVHRETYGMGYVKQAEFMSRGLPEEDQDYPRIGLRSDFGAFLPQAAPRFVWDETESEYDPRCDEEDTGTELSYPFEAFDGSGEFDVQVTGNRSFDYNTNGLAQVGLWLDLLADARAISESNPPTSTVDFDAIFHSAEAYIRMWEWIENCTPDEVDPTITCPATIITSGPVGGTTVVYDPPPTAEDFCDWIPPDVTTVATDIPSGAHFDPGVTTVTATATDSSENTSQCQFDVQVSCFNVNQAHVGTKEGRGNKVSFKGTFRPATTVDLTAVDVMYTIDDGNGHSWEFTIPAGSFEVEGKPSLQKYHYNAPKGADLDVSARFDFGQCSFEVEFTDVEGTDEIIGASLTFFLQTDYAPNHNYGQDTVELEVTAEHLQYEREVPLDCCPQD